MSKNGAALGYLHCVESRELNKHTSLLCHLDLFTYNAHSVKDNMCCPARTFALCNLNHTTRIHETVHKFSFQGAQHNTGNFVQILRCPCCPKAKASHRGPLSAAENSPVNTAF